MTKKNVNTAKDDKEYMNEAHLNQSWCQTPPPLQRLPLVIYHIWAFLVVGKEEILQLEKLVLDQEPTCVMTEYY